MTAKVFAPLLSVSRLDAAPVPLTVKPPVVEIAPAAIVPVVFTEVVPVISEAPLMVPEVMTGLVNVLLLKVSVVLRPTNVSVAVGKVKVPVLTIELINGAVKVLLANVSVAASVTTTPVLGNVAEELTPVPPLAVARVPDVMIAAERAGISDAAKEAPAVTRPLASTVTFV